tara:strand:+ start:20278 stop:29775 length:9498 start_codon:yes stop_codon:yes gene_type:complete
MITNLDIRRRIGRMEQSYSLADPYGHLGIQPVISSGAVNGFNPISAVYCPATERIYCGNADRFIHVFNPKKTNLFKSNTHNVIHEDTTEYNASAQYDSEYIPEADSENGSMHKIASFTNTASGDIEIKFSILIQSGASYYYGYKISKNNGSSSLSLSNVIAEGCYNNNIDKSISRNAPKTIEDLSEYTPYATTVTVSAEDTIEIWVGGAMKNCATSGGSSTQSSSVIKVKDISAKLLYEDALEESIRWNSPSSFVRKDYIGNFTSYENKYYVDGAFSPSNEKIYYAYNSKDLSQNINGGFGVAKLNPYTNIIEKEISLYNIDPVSGGVYNDANLSKMKNMLPLPKKLIYCPTNKKIYILHGDPIKSWITILDSKSDKILGNLTHESFQDSSDLEYCPVNDRIYVTNSAGSSISVIDPHGSGSMINIPPFTPDTSTALLLHLDEDFSDSVPSASTGVTKFVGDGQLIKDRQAAADIYNKRLAEKDFNKHQYTENYTIFDGESCQKIPYRSIFNSINDEFTIEMWVRPDKNYFQTKRVYNGNTGKFSYEQYNPEVDTNKIPNGDNASMLLFSFGNLHSAYSEGAFGLVLMQGTSHKDSNRGKLKLLSRTLNNLNEHTVSPDKPENKIKFGEWSHITISKEPSHTLSGNSFTKNANSKLIIFVNGNKWGEISPSDTIPNGSFTNFEINENNSPYLYIGGTKGSQLLNRVSQIDFDKDEITTIENHNLLDGQEITLYSKAGKYPDGVDSFTKYYVKIISDNKITLYLNQDDALSSAVIAPINLENLKSITFDDLFISRPQETDNDWMHYAGFINGFRISNVSRYWRNFRPNRFAKFVDDEETILSINDNKVSVRNTTLELKSIGILETTNPPPGLDPSLTLTQQRFQGIDLSSLPSWAEEPYLEEPGASFQLPFGWNNENLIELKDRNGNFDFKDGKEFVIIGEANFINPSKIDQSFDGLNKPISIARYVSDDGKVEYELLVSKINFGNEAPKGSGLYFKQYNQGNLVVDLFGEIYAGAEGLGNNKWHNFSVERDSSGKYSIYHNGDLLNSVTPTSDLYDKSISKQGKFYIGRGSWNKTLAIGQYLIKHNNKKVLYLDPLIGNQHNILGSTFSGPWQGGICFTDMKDIEIISLGNVKEGSSTQDSFDQITWKPIKEDNENVPTKFIQNSRFDRLNTIDTLNKGVAFFKGDFTPSYNNPSSWRLKGEGSFIKHLPGQYHPTDKALYAFHPSEINLMENNFLIECSIMPLNLSNLDSSSNVNSNMGLLCCNYDDLDNSTIDWSDCPDYNMDDGYVFQQCSNDLNDSSKKRWTWQGYWQSTSSNTGKVGWELKINSSGKIEFNFGSQTRDMIPGNSSYYFNGTSRNLTSSSTLKYGDWYTVSVSRIGHNVYLYINGNKEATLNIGNDTILEHPIDLGLSKYENMGLLIGKSYNGVTTDGAQPYYFTGLMDEVRVRPSRGYGHHTPYPDQSFTLDKSKKTYKNKSFLDGGTLEPVDYLYLNFDHAYKNKSTHVAGVIPLIYFASEEGQSIEEEGRINVRDNLQEGLVKLNKDGKLTISGSSNLNLNENFTIEGWFYSDTLEDNILLSRKNSNGGGWNLEIKNQILTLNIFDNNGSLAESVKELAQSSLVKAEPNEWNHFAFQIENKTDISLFLNGACCAFEKISLSEFSYTELATKKRIIVGENARQGSLYFDNLKISQSALYDNYNKPINQQGIIETIKEPDVFHVDDENLNLNYGESNIFNHSLKLKSDYSNGDLGYLTIDGDDFNFGSEDFTVEFFFRCDSLNDLPLGTSIIVGKGIPSDHTFYVGLETESVGSGRRARLVAEAGGIKLSAKENDSRTITNGPPPLYFYDLDYFYDNSITKGYSHKESDYIIQRYKHVMLCRHTYAGTSYLSLFVDKRLVASSHEISTYDTTSYNHSYTTQSLNDLSDTTYNLSIGTGLTSQGPVGVFFSGNINLLKVEKGTNIALSNSYANSRIRLWFNPTSSDVKEWYTGASLGSFHELSNSQNSLNGSMWYPTLDSWNLQPSIYSNTVDGAYSYIRRMGLPVPGGTELFLDFQEGVKDLSSKNRTITISSIRSGVVDSSDSNFESMYTPEENLYSGYFGRVSDVILNQNEYASDDNNFLLAYDYKNNWNYFGDKWSISMWLKPENLDDDPTILSRKVTNSSGGYGMMDLSLTSTGKIELSFTHRLDSNSSIDTVFLGSTNDSIKENEWTYLRIEREGVNNFRMVVNNSSLSLYKNGWNKIIPDFEGSNSEILSIGRKFEPDFDNYQQFKGYITDLYMSTDLGETPNPSSVKFSLKFDKLEDSSIDIFRGKPKTDENTVLLLPFDRNLDNESGKELPEEKTLLQHIKYTKLGDKVWWTNTSEAGRKIVGDYEVHGNVSIIEDRVGNNALNIPSSTSDYLKLQRRENSPKILKIDPTDNLGTCDFSGYSSSQAELPVDCLNPDDYSLEFFFRIDDVDNYKQLGVVPIIGGEYIDSNDELINYFYVALEINSQYDGSRSIGEQQRHLATVMVCKYDEWDHQQSRPKDLFSNIRLRKSGSAWLDIGDSVNKDFVHVYVCRKDGYWFLYVNGDYHYHIKEGERKSWIDTKYGKGDIRLNTWNIAGPTKVTGNNMFPVRKFSGKVDMVRETSGTIPYNPIEKKMNAGQASPQVSNIVVKNDITSEVGFPAKNSSGFWDRILNELSCPASVPSCTVQLFPFEPIYTSKDLWTNEKDTSDTIVSDLNTECTFGNFWNIDGEINKQLISSDTCPIIDQDDKIVGSGSGEYDGSCYSILEDSERWDFENEPFTIEFWYKQKDTGVSNNTGPFLANGTCVVARQGYGFSKDSLGWGVELSYVKEDLNSLFFYWSQYNRLKNKIKGISSETSALYWDENTTFTKLNWEDSLTKLDTPEMRFYFCVDDGGISSSGTNASTPIGKDNERVTSFTISMGSPEPNKWEHYAIVREETNPGIITTYKNGKKIDRWDSRISRYNEWHNNSWTGQLNIKSPNNDAVLAIGTDTRFVNNGWYLNGNIDELRISKGIARYTDEFDTGQREINNGSVESTISTITENTIVTPIENTATITYCPLNKNLYAFTSNTGTSYEISPLDNVITNSTQWSDSSIERVKESYYCPINNTILISSYDGVYRIYSFLPMTKSIINTFNVYDEGRFVYAPPSNKMLYVCSNYLYEISD